MKFALNHMVAPRLGHAAFFDLARRVGVADVEIRNDLPGVALADGTPAAEVGEAAKARGLGVLTINALQRFNLWDDARAAEAKAMIDQCAASGAKALILCPVNDVDYRAGGERAPRRIDQGAERAETDAVGGRRPRLRRAARLRRMLSAVEGGSDRGDRRGNGGDVFRVVHDTFHHFVAGETKMFPT